ncbi:hypothetical protein RRG08_042797 [Elysia crispata]|uniref:Uncharacterized protein n=1 Tax=Elysia crispata TaxID=231223 RepID=A0AAE0YCX0_9GAST|nr:hypothetical protein RRG08_042797 [Elysia crispata]
MFSSNPHFVKSPAIDLCSLPLSDVFVKVKMDSGDGGAEEDSRETHSGGGEQEPKTETLTTGKAQEGLEETLTTNIEGAEVSEPQSDLQLNNRESMQPAGLEQNDIADGNLSRVSDDKDGDRCEKQQEESVGNGAQKNDDSVIVACSVESDSSIQVGQTKMQESPRHTDEEKDHVVGLGSLSTEKNESLKTDVVNEGKDSSALFGIQECSDVTDDSQGMSYGNSPPENESSLHVGGNEKSGEEKEDKEGDGNIKEAEQMSQMEDDITDRNFQLAPGSVPSEEQATKDSVSVDHQLDNQFVTLPVLEDQVNHFGPDSEKQKENGDQPDEGDLCVTPSTLGGEIDDFFASSTGAGNYLSPGEDVSGSNKEDKGGAKSAESPQAGFFPALDNVDLETDEELLDGEKGEDKTENKEEVKEEPGHETKTTNISNNDFENKQQAGYPADKEARGMREDRPTTPMTSPIFCQDNYQVCRELQPGIKECLILETGEQFICVNPPHEEHGGLPPRSEAEKSVYLVKHSEDMESKGRNLRFDSPPLVTDNGLTPQVYRTTHPTMLKIDNVLSPSEAFAYVSFDDGDSGESKGIPDQNFTEGPSQRKFLNGMQQGYITRNGIPIIMDDAEEEVKRTNPSKERPFNLSDLGGQRNTNRNTNSNNVFSFKQGDLDIHPSGYHSEFESSDILSSSGRQRYKEVEEDSGEDFFLWERKKETARKMGEDESEELIELVPDDTENSDGKGRDTPTLAESGAFWKTEANSLRLNLNNNNDGEDKDAEGDGTMDENNSANGKVSRGSRNGKARSRPQSSSKSVNRSTHDQSSEYSNSHRLRPDSHSYSSHRHSPSRSNYLHDSSDYRTRDSGSLYRSGEHSSIDSSRLSTRFRHLDRGDMQSAASRLDSSTVPRFNTLHDQQVSWLDMFKMIEAQHRTELRSQHEQHERLLHEMQKNMARELSKQQDTLKHSLSAHREILEELSPGRHRDSRQNKNQSRQFDDIEGSSVDSHRSVESPADQSSHTTLQGVDVSLKNPPPFSRYSDLYDNKDPDDLPVKRSLESELSSPSRPADTSLSQSHISLGRDKLLRGGVYSSPMPLAKSKHKNSPRAHKSSSEGTVHSSPKDDKSRNANSTRKLPTDLRRNRLEQECLGSTDVSQAESEDFLSPRTRINLREKHARHLADLRAYYEEELRDMRQMLQASQRKLERGGGDGSSSNKSQSQVTSLQQPLGQSMEEKILAKENEELRQRCRELQDDYHDSKSEIRELQQKIQGLEIRASDYAERYDQSQAQVLNLGSRLEELTEFAKEKESTSSDLEVKNKKVAESLQMAYKKEKELTESLHSAKTTIQRLVDKYEMLEKDYTLLKESATANQEKLLQSRQEAIETNNKFSRLEMDNKQLQHDNEILKHELTMARSSLSMRTSYEDSFSPSRTREQGRANHNASTSVRARSRDRSQHNSSPTSLRNRNPRANSPDDETVSPVDDLIRSPILRAEQELRKLQGSVGGAVGSESREFAPKLQRKFYGTEVPSQTGATSSNRSRNVFSPSSKTGSSLEKKGRSAPQGKITRASANRPSSSKAEPLNFITEKDRAGRVGNQRDKKSRDNSADRDQNRSSRKPTFASNGMSGELAMERIKSGDIVSRPDWEDVYTSMAPSRSGGFGIDSTSNRSATREQILQERVRNIDNLEKKYDKLVTQKRKYESSLSKLPAHGHRGEKERLEAELDELDKELGSVRMSLKRFHVLKSTI